MKHAMPPLPAAPVREYTSRPVEAQLFDYRCTMTVYERFASLQALNDWKRTMPRHLRVERVRWDDANRSTVTGAGKGV